MQIVKHQTKTSIFQTIVKLINIYWVFKFQAILWSRGAKIGTQKVDIKTDFKEELLQNTLRFQTIVGAPKKQISAVLLFYPLRWSGVTE